MAAYSKTGVQRLHIHGFIFISVIMEEIQQSGPNLHVPVLSGISALGFHSGSCVHREHFNILLLERGHCCFGIDVCVQSLPIKHNDLKLRVRGEEREKRKRARALDPISLCSV